MCSCSLLCSLAEEEIKKEPDVVEGMDASLRSKGKSLKAMHVLSEVKHDGVGEHNRIFLLDFERLMHANGH